MTLFININFRLLLQIEAISLDIIKYVYFILYKAEIKGNTIVCRFMLIT